jgi:hypothetical protein
MALMKIGTIMSEISTKSIKNPRIRIIPIEMRIKLISLAGKLMVWL